MSETIQRLLFWAPRLFCIAFAAFLGIFALDVFDMPVGPMEKAFALMMHLIPSATVLVALAIVWRWEWVGALIFPLLAAFHLLSMWGRRLDWSGYAVIEVPLVLLGILFLVNWRNRKAFTPRTG
jgi:hypothetical protein